MKPIFLETDPLYQNRAGRQWLEKAGTDHVLSLPELQMSKHALVGENEVGPC